jgi:hypothetical protein
MSCWSDASPDFKKKLKDWLGDIVYREFLHQVPYNCPIDVITDWWSWSERTTLQDINYIYQELFRMVRDFDPVTWSDEPLPVVTKRPSSVVTSIVPSSVPLPNPCIILSQQSDLSPWCMNAQNDFCDSSQHGIVINTCLFLSDDAREFHYQSMQSDDSIDFSDTPPVEDFHTLRITPTPIPRFRPSQENRNSIVRPFRRHK